MWTGPLLEFLNLASKKTGCSVVYEFEIKQKLPVYPEYCRGYTYAKKYSLFIRNLNLTGYPVFQPTVLLTQSGVRVLGRGEVGQIDCTLL